MISISSPRIYFQSQKVADEFNQNKLINNIEKWHKSAIRDERKTIEILPDAVYSNWSSTIKHEGKIFTPSLYLAGKDQTELHKELEREPNHELTRSVVSCNNGSSKNYYHWTVQTLPSLINAQQYLNNNYTLILPENLSSYQLEWLSLAGLDKGHCQHLYLRERDVVFSRELVAPLTLYKPFDYQPSRRTLLKFRKQINERMISEEDHASLPNKLYISRSDSKKIRGLKSEKKLEKSLEELGFFILKASSLSVKDQIKLFKNAKTIVAPHGAGLSNLIFANPQCRIFEINQSNYFNPCFSALHSVLGLPGVYNHYIAPVAFNDKVSKDMRHQQKTRVNQAKLVELIMD